MRACVCCVALRCVACVTLRASVRRVELRCVRCVRALRALRACVACVTLRCVIKDIEQILHRGNILILLEGDGGIEGFPGPAGGGRRGFVPAAISVYLFPFLGCLRSVVTVYALFIVCEKREVGGGEGRTG